MSVLGGVVSRTLRRVDQPQGRGRRGARPVLVAGVVVALVGIALAFYQFGRNSDAPPPTVASQSAPSPAGTGTGGVVAPLAAGAAVAGGGGSRTGPAGLPLGYSHDQDGAATAAANYVMWLNSLKIVDKPTADAMATAVAATPQARAQLVEDFDLLRTAKAETIRQDEPSRGAYAIAAYSADRARVYVWSAATDQVKGEDRVLTWPIFEVELVWAGGDWKLQGSLVSRVDAPAVDPMGNPSAKEKAEILSQTPDDPGQLTDFPGQTWLEFANAPH